MFIINKRMLPDDALRKRREPVKPSKGPLHAQQENRGGHDNRSASSYTAGREASLKDIRVPNLLAVGSIVGRMLFRMDESS